MAKPADVFVSYSREDKERVLSLASELRNAGVSLWIDEGNIDGATMWGEEIVNALEGAKVLLLMVSEKSVISHNVIKEVVLASERKEHILPIHLEPTRIPPGLKYPLAGIQHVEYFQGESAENLKTIIRSLERIGVTVKPPEPPTPTRVEKAPSPSMHSSAPVTDLGTAIAVIPFDNLSPDQDTDYFSDGLTDELINILSVITEIDVVSRMSSAHYKGTKADALTIARELGARYLAGGSVRKFNDNIRISARLVDASINREIWAQTYKGKLDDIFDIQEQVAQQIADALKLKLSLTEKVALTKRSTDNAQAFDLYLRGKEYLYQLTKKSVEYSIQLFEKAIQLDSRYAAAYAACAEAYGQFYSFFEKIESNREKAQELSFKALMYDNTLPEAYATLGFSYYLREEYDEALAACKKSMELDPDSFSTYWILGRVYFATDRYPDAILMFEKAAQLNPKFYTAYNDLKLAYNALHDTANATRMHDTIVDFFPSFIMQYPDDARARMIYACNLAEAGRKEESIAELTTAVNLAPSDAQMMYNASCTYAQLGEKQKSLETLRGSFDAGYSNFSWVKRDSDLDPIRNDAEYIELMKGR
ncbi:MAG: TPR end-of-group domain-containing protein [Candidatus Kapaibacterium sp.]